MQNGKVEMHKYEYRVTSTDKMFNDLFDGKGHQSLYCVLCDKFIAAIKMPLDNEDKKRIYKGKQKHESSI